MGGPDTKQYASNSTNNLNAESIPEQSAAHLSPTQMLTDPTTDSIHSKLNGAFVVFCVILFLLGICTLLYFLLQKHVVSNIKKEQIELKKIREDRKKYKVPTEHDTDSDTGKYDISLSPIPKSGVIQDKLDFMPSTLTNSISYAETLYGVDAVEVTVVE